MMTENMMEVCMCHEMVN